MKTYLTVSVAMLTGMAIGGFAVQGLQAQGKTPVYLVTEIDVTNPEAYGKEFAPKAQATIKAAGGKLIAIGRSGGAGAKGVTSLSGTAPKRAVIQQWESIDALNTSYKSADYQAALKIGEKYATFRRYAIDSAGE
jgi:uncharacterized protein (DUF1330 family)